MPPTDRFVIRFAAEPPREPTPYGRWADPDRGAEVVVRADPTALCRAVVAHPGLGPGGADESAWLASWRAAEAAAQRAIDSVVATSAVVTEPGVARSVVSALPDGSTLVVSSSMPVRDASVASCDAACARSTFAASARWVSTALKCARAPSIPVCASATT